MTRRLSIGLKVLSGKWLEQFGTACIRKIQKGTEEICKDVRYDRVVVQSVTQRKNWDGHVKAVWSIILRLERYARKLLCAMTG